MERRLLPERDEPRPANGGIRNQTMNQTLQRLRRLSLGLIALGFALAAAQAAELRPETVRAFEQHLSETADWGRKPAAQEPFLKTAPDAQRHTVKTGEVVVEPFDGKGDIPIEKGIIHHWVGAVFVPEASADEAVSLLRDFDRYKEIYPDSVVDSKTLSRNGDDYRAYLRLRKQRIVTVVLNTEYDAEFERVGSERWRSRSVSKRIAQVKDPGDPAERELPVGQDSGFLWRIATFWRFEEADGGVYLECEVVALTRGVPYGLGWLIRPIIRSFPRESLTETLNDTRNALLKKSRNEDASRVSRADKNPEPTTVAVRMPRP